MKRLWVKYLSLLLILAQTSVLFADTLTFNNGLKINGKLISISEEHELDPNTGVTSEVTFKVDDSQLKMISEELIVGKVDNSTLMFDKKSIYKITDDKGNILFTNNLKLKNEIVPKIVPSERIKVNETAIDTCNQLSLAYLLLSIFFIKKKPILNTKIGEPIIKSLKAGISFVYNTKAILVAITLDMVAVLFGGAIALLPIYAQDILQVGSEGFGVLRAAPAVGSVIIMFISAHIPLTKNCLLYTSPSPRDRTRSRMPSSA